MDPALSSSNNAVRRSTFVLISAATATAGLFIGTAIMGNYGGHSPTDGRNARGESEAAQRTPDVVHNPPLIYGEGEPVSLTFDLVCPDKACSEVSAALSLTDSGRNSVVLKATGSDHVEFDVPAAAAASGGFVYSAQFTFADGETVDYPSAGGTMRAIAMSKATEVDLGRAEFAANDQDAGDLVVSGGWGDGPGQFGINAQLSGPSSFDVDPTTGDIVILDQVNSRVVRVGADGSSRAMPIDLRAGVPDLAVAPDGMLDVLYVNAVSGASLQQFDADGGKAVRDVPLATPSANSIRRLGDTVAVEADDSYWVPISQGTAIASTEEQIATSAPGLSENGHLVVRKHMRELGNEVRVLDVGPEDMRAWRLTGTTALGPVIVAAPLPNGGVAVVQSQFNNTQSQYSIVTLGDGEARTIEVPQSLYAGLYDPSEFRLDGTTLYQVRSTKAGYSIYRYEL